MARSTRSNSSGGNNKTSKKVHKKTASNQQQQHSKTSAVHHHRRHHHQRVGCGPSSSTAMMVGKATIRNNPQQLPVSNNQPAAHSHASFKAVTSRNRQPRSSSGSSSSSGYPTTNNTSAGRRPRQPHLVVVPTKKSKKYKNTNNPKKLTKTTANKPPKQQQQPKTFSKSKGGVQLPTFVGRCSNKKSNGDADAAPVLCCWMKNAGRIVSSNDGVRTSPTNLPANDPSRRRAGSTTPTDDNNNEKTGSSWILPTLQIPTAAALTALDTELQQFAQFVQLDADEVQARNGWIQQLESLARQAFAPQQKQQKQHVRYRHGVPYSVGDPHNNDDGVTCRVFGSFATLPVCTFQSDVDLALWGVVPTPATASTTVASATTTLSSSPKQPPPPQSPPCTMKRARSQQNRQKEQQQQQQERKERWLRLMDAGNATAMDDVPVSFSAATSGVVMDLTPDGNSNDKDDKDETEPSVIVCNDQNAAATVVNRAPESQSHVDTADDGLDGNNEVLKDPWVIDRVGDEEGILKSKQSVETSSLSSNRDVATERTTTTVTADGMSVATAIEIADTPAIDRYDDDDDADKETYHHSNDSGNDSDNDDDDDDDSADPLEAYVMEKGESMFADDDDDGHALEDSSVDDDDNHHHHHHQPPRKRRRMAADEAAGWLTNGSSSETENDDDDEDDGMQVGFFSSASKSSKSTQKQHQLGPTGWIRSEVVNALTRLTNQLRKHQQQRLRLADRIQLIKTARVPIIKVATCLGVEADIAVGGHNGTDTSAYAASLVQRFPSFSAVVLFLKTLLTHQSLDAPFTGGLGSYKLYVLVAHHMERHLSLGGSDRPGEIILSFLFRYGMNPSMASCKPRGKQKRHHHRHFTTLTQSVPLDGPNGGCADLSNVFRLDDCIDLFRQCFDRLWDKIVRMGRQPPRKNGRRETEASFLADLICPERLQRERSLARRQLQAAVGQLARGPQVSSASRTASSTAVSTTTTTTTATATATKNRSSGNNQSSTVSLLPRGDLTAEEIAAGYGFTALKAQR